MPTNIVIPELGESVTEGVIATWRKKPGEFVKQDETVLDLETDKITMELPAPASGVLSPSNKVGDRVKVGSVVGTIDDSAKVPTNETKATTTLQPVGASVVAPPSPAPVTTSNGSASTASAGHADGDVRATPLARKLAQEHGVDLSKVHGSGAGGRVREQDVLEVVRGGGGGGAIVVESKAPPTSVSAPTPAPTNGGVRRERMSTLRQRIAQRLVEAQHNAAMLTTFNEVDMSAVMALRTRHKEAFEKKHGVGLGFMSFFVKACVQALSSFPLVNASIVRSAEGELEVEHHDSKDIAIAVGTPKGLVVPVLRSCEALSFAQIESGIKELAVKARDGKLTLNDLQGGTFTITNGGIYGSLMSTPILNPPQTGILGMHAIKNRAVEDPTNPGHVAIRPMMYLALSYDHRLIDGAEAVQFLVTIKNALEQPERLLIGV
ncbi:MAG: 2-oxoglutarate dehydrogenase complex dihydrolipoyllysine-residue succinyltransferase [Phycisphaeraceae bacterium]|nr:2-oxoglutarate dehydrogenase complex dihydrolipoyllysine-residue succinyltransferase [Phycisphaeraceae bacterium]